MPIMASTIGPMMRVNSKSTKLTIVLFVTLVVVINVVGCVGQPRLELDLSFSDELHNGE